MTFRGTLPSGSALKIGDDVVSNSGRYRLFLQTDGNLVLYDLSAASKALWASNTNGQAVSQCVMQSDGNLVIYGFPDGLWASHTENHPNSFLAVQDDGNVVIYEPNAPLWASNTVQP